jgi:hypothetical protein
VASIPRFEATRQRQRAAKILEPIPDWSDNCRAFWRFLFSIFMYKLPFMFKRRPLGTNKTDQPQAPTSGASAPPVEQPQQAVRPPQGAQAPQGSQPPRPQANNVGANPRRNRNRNRSRNNQNQATPGQPQSQAVGAAIGAPANKQNPQQRSGNRQRPQQNAQQNSGRKNQNRRPQNRRPTKPQFPAYIQRDLLPMKARRVLKKFV